MHLLRSARLLVFKELKSNALLLVLVQGFPIRGSWGILGKQIYLKF